MIGHETIDDETWAMLFSVRSDLVDHLTRVGRVPRDIAEDCVADGLMDVVSAFDPIAVSTAANAMYIKKETQLYFLLKDAASRRLNRARKHIAKHTSDDTPIGPEDGDARLRDLFVGRQNSAERVENYAEWKMFSRRGGCPLSPDEIDLMFGINHVCEM